MSKKSKLSDEQWAEVRKEREASKTPYRVLADKWGVSDVAIIKRAKAEGWSDEAAQTTKKERKVSAKVRKPKSANQKVSANQVANLKSATPPPCAASALTPSAFDQLTDMEGLFVREYLVDLNGTQAATRAGYSERSAGQLAYQLLQKPSIQAAIKELMADRFERLDLDGDELIRQWAEMVAVDPNELVQYRRLCCRNCWGEDNQYQYLPEEYKRAKLRHDEKRAEMLGKSSGAVDIGEFDGRYGDWYDRRKDPNTECPNCFGEGVGETFFNDTRKLSLAARRLFSGVKEGKEGIEILMKSQEKAMDSLARVWGMYKDKEAEVNINIGASGEELAKIYDERMRVARERQQKVLIERGIIEGSAVRETDRPEGDDLNSVFDDRMAKARERQAAVLAERGIAQDK